MSGLIDRIAHRARIDAKRAQLQAEFDQLHQFRDAFGVPLDQLVRLWNPDDFPPDGLSIAAVFDRIAAMKERSP